MNQNQNLPNFILTIGVIMWYVIAVVAGLLVGFSIGFVVCGALASGKCSDCRLKELKEFEDDKSE